MNEKYEFGSQAPGERIVYVRAVALDELPEEIRAQAAGLEHLYALHDANGERLAVVKDRRTAFFLAREHEVTALSVH